MPETNRFCFALEEIPSIYSICVLSILEKTKNLLSIICIYIYKFPFYTKLTACNLRAFVFKTLEPISVDVTCCRRFVDASDETSKEKTSTSRWTADRLGFDLGESLAKERITRSLLLHSSIAPAN